MGRKIFNAKIDLDNIQLSRQRIILLLLATLLIFNAFATKSASLTQSFDISQDPPIFRNNPQRSTQPDFLDDLIPTDTLTSPPLDLKEILDDLYDPNDHVADDTSTSTGGTGVFDDGWPRSGDDGTDTGDDGTTDTTDNGRDPGGGDVDVSKEDMSIPKRPNKAGNLPNMSDFDIFSQISDSKRKIELNLNIDTFGILFLVILTGSLLLHYTILPRILNKLDEEEETITHGLFISPQINAEEMKRQKERIRSLKGFQEYVNEIVEQCKLLSQNNDYDKAVIIGYHKLDKAFSEFAKFRRSKHLTPLEHVQMHFNANEIDFQCFEKLVHLFYQVRFGRKEISERQVLEFIYSLENLVVYDFNQLSFV